MTESGWIKLHRSLIDWEWYDDHNATRLLIHLIITCNYQDNRWKGMIIESGSLVCSWDSLAASVGLSKQQVRTAVAKLEKSGEVTRKPTNKFQLLILVKWDKMQAADKEKKEQITPRATLKQHSNNTQITPIKEGEERKKEKKREDLIGRKQKFASTLEPFLELYGRDMINNFYKHWTQLNRSGTKFKQEMEKTWSVSYRLQTWSANEQRFGPKKEQPKETVYKTNQKAKDKLEKAQKEEEEYLNKVNKNGED